MKIYKNVHLWLKVSKMWSVRNFCHFRASRDPLKLQKSQKNVVFSRFRLPIDENRPFLAGNFCAPNLTPFHPAKKFSAPQHAWRLQMRVEKVRTICFWHVSFLAAKIDFVGFFQFFEIFNFLTKIVFSHIFSGFWSNFLVKIVRNMKMNKNVHLTLKAMKMWFDRNFCHFRAPRYWPHEA